MNLLTYGSLLLNRGFDNFVEKCFLTQQENPCKLCVTILVFIRFEVLFTINGMTYIMYILANSCFILLI